MNSTRVFIWRTKSEDENFWELKVEEIF